MATQVITRQLCDFCLEDDEQTPDARRILIALAGVEYEVDVCEVHGKPFADLETLLDEHARRNGKVKSKSNDEPATCSICSKVLKNRASLMAHSRNEHGKTLAEIEGQHAPYKCDSCERSFTTPQGLAVHRSRSHRQAA